MARNSIELKDLDDHALDYWKFFLEDQKTNIVKADDFRFVFHADRDLASERVKMITHGNRSLTNEMWAEIKQNINQDQIDQIITDMMNDAIHRSLLY